MRFVDLFAGLGGFHLALKQLGHDGVFASEVDETLRALYERNFGIRPAGDIREVKATDIPKHDILCAGFPCQPFSKAGAQPGFSHPELGGLYQEIIRIIKSHHPRFLIIENVPNLERHDEGRTWASFESLLRMEGYDVSRKILSPHHFGIPQIRERVYIVGSLGSLDSYHWPAPPPGIGLSIRDVLDANPANARPIPEKVKQCLAVWQEFLDRMPPDEKVPHPLWAMEFGATYPYEHATPGVASLPELQSSNGAFGIPLAGLTRQEIVDRLPSHARRPGDRFPDWKVKFIRLNRKFYDRHKLWLDEWKTKISEFPSSFQKLEWNCQGDPRVLRNYVVQIRASGVRVKRATTSPSLVAMTATQVPIITWEDRYMTPEECKRLQSMDELRWLPDRPGKAYEALGNAVNVEVARRVTEALLRSDQPSCISAPTFLPPAAVGRGVRSERLED